MFDLSHILALRDREHDTVDAASVLRDLEKIFRARYLASAPVRRVFLRPDVHRSISAHLMGTAMKRGGSPALAGLAADLALFLEAGGRVEDYRPPEPPHISENALIDMYECEWGQVEFVTDQTLRAPFSVCPVMNPTLKRETSDG